MKSTRRVFSEFDSNTRIHNGELDSVTLENDLKNNFEDCFNKNFEIVTQLVDNPEDANPDYKNALIELTKYGILSVIRPPIKKKEIKDILTNFLFNEILPNAAPSLKAELEEYKKVTEQTKYINEFEYSKSVKNIFKLMGNINCVVSVLRCNHFFILPDCSSICKREKINKYFNPDIKNVAMVGIPLGSKIFLHAESEKFHKFNDKVIQLTEKSLSLIEEINYYLFVNSYKQIACENKQYLIDFINKIDVLEKKYGK
ncbi:MAG: hypothetical protein PHT69_01575 [Bacteroidales bacterium]|nr:hypothetical protein [Bacteroidales bacterium]